MKVRIRRQWNDWRIAGVELSDLDGLHWDNVSGGVNARAPQFFIHGYITCDKIVEDFAHSCMHGQGPHNIKVCLTKKDNTLVWKELLSIVGAKPVRPDMKEAGKK